MSRQVVTDVITRISVEPMFLARGFENALVTSLQELREHSGLSMDAERALAARRTDDLAMTYGFRNTDRDKPFAYDNGVAVIPIHGTLINRYHGSWGYVTGYNFIRAQLNAALDDGDVKLIVFDINSYGGECAGCFELADEIRAARSQKLLLAVVDSNCCSAAYALASGAPRIVVTPSGQAGSIGVIAMHVSQQKMLENWGLEVTLIYEEDHKADGNPYEKLPDNVKADIAASVKKRMGEFVALVMRNRKSLTEAMIRDTKSRSFRADDALELKLIDGVQTPTEAVSSFLAEMGDKNPFCNDEDEEMTTAADASAPEATAQAAAAATTAERARVKTIMGCDEAKGRQDLASHLALETDFSADACKGILSKAAKESSGEPAKDEPAEEDKKDEPAEEDKKDEAAAPKVIDRSRSAFAEAMGASAHPNVGADAEGAGDEKPSRAKSAMALAGFSSTKDTAKKG